MLAYKRLPQIIKCDILDIHCPTVGRDLPKIAKTYEASKMTCFKSCDTFCWKIYCTKILVLMWVVFKLVITVHDAPHLCVYEKDVLYCFCGYGLW